MPHDDPTSESDIGLRKAGAMLGEFRLLRRLGRGGMADVWLAEQVTLKRNVALKLLRSELMADEQYVKRFQAEAKAAGGLNHPNIVQVYTVGAEHGQHYIAQEYVQGQTLKAVLQKRGPMDLPLALRIMRQVASALQAAGERGIVHRDIKPENIMLTRKWEAKVADFGLAQLQGGDRLDLTQEGVTMGTPLYMSPEQVSGQKIDQRSDIYSFGITSYHILAGRPPFEGDNAVGVAVKHLHEKPAPLDEVRPDLPLPVCQLVNRAMAKQPENRYQDAKSLVEDIRKLSDALRQGEPLELMTLSGEFPAHTFPVRRPGLVLMALCLLALLLSAGIGWESRLRVPPVNPDALSGIRDAGSAKQQYVDAMFEIDNEDAFKAVIKYYNTPDNRVWIRRAHEQLALLYLKDRRRAEDAREQLEELPLLENDNEELNAEKRIGEAYLFAMENNTQRADAILRAEADNFDEYLSGSWKQLERDVRRLVGDENER